MTDAHRRCLQEFTALLVACAQAAFDTRLLTREQVCCALMTVSVTHFLKTDGGDRAQWDELCREVWERRNG